MMEDIEFNTYLNEISIQISLCEALLDPYMVASIIHDKYKNKYTSGSDNSCNGYLEHGWIHKLQPNMCSKDVFEELNRDIQTVIHVLENHPSIYLQKMVTQIRDERFMKNVMSELKDLFFRDYIWR